MFSNLVSFYDSAKINLISKQLLKHSRKELGQFHHKWLSGHVVKDSGNRAVVLNLFYDPLCLIFTM